MKCQSKKKSVPEHEKFTYRYRSTVNSLNKTFLFWNTTSVAYLEQVNFSICKDLEQLLLTLQLISGDVG